MKKIFLFSFATLAMTLLSFTNKAEEVCEEVVNCEQTVAVNEEEALYCKVTNGTTTLECWFCNCEKLAEKLD